jgi:hypothetical protein
MIIIQLFSRISEAQLVVSKNLSPEIDVAEISRLKLIQDLGIVGRIHLK